MLHTSGRCLYICILLTLAMILCSCQQQPKLTDGSLFNVSEVTFRLLADTARIEFIDNSLIFFEDYNALKSNVLVYANIDQVRTYKHLHTVGSTKNKEKNFLKKYNSEDLLFTEKTYNDNPTFKDYAFHICQQFDASDWWNFRGALDFMNRQEENLGESPIDLLFQLSLLDDKGAEQSKAYKRLFVIGEMIRDTGMSDAFTKERKPGDAFVKKLNFFFEKKNLPIVK